MAELSQTGAGAEVYTPRSLQVLRTLLNWIAFFFQIFLQIVRGATSLTQLPSCIGLRHQLSSSPQFKPLPVVEFSESPSPSTSVHIAGEKLSDTLADQRLEKLTVVLDLDDTLVCAYETSSLPDHIRTQATEAGLDWFELECVSSDKEFEGKPKVNYVTVFERPGLRKFLKELGEFADLVLFTAALEGYARPLVDRIDDDNSFRLRLYRPSTISTEYREHVKDLSRISKDLCRVVIVDNNPFSFLLQPRNGIPCIPFLPHKPDDKELLEVILPLLRQLSKQKDVRLLLQEKFRMIEWFQKHGIPASVWDNVV